MKLVWAHYGKFICLPLLSAVLLSGCATIGDAPQSCTVFDPDLAQGSYVGGCKDGLADGYGEVRGTGSYRGDFLAGKKHGKGIKVMPNGDRYAGDFSDDYRHGKGMYIWGPNTPWVGDRYEGEYRRDLRHGWGVFLWNSGDRYEGQWRDDLRLELSAMEMRRSMANEGAAKVFHAGNTVCTTIKLGLAGSQRLRGEVESISGDAVTIRLIEVEDGLANYLGTMVKTGDTVSGALLDWQPCRKE